MEVHFPHLTTGIVQPKRIRKARGRTRIIALAIALAALVGVIGASSAKADIIQGLDASYIIDKGEVLYVEREQQRYLKFVYAISYFGNIFHCVSISNSTTAKVEVECLSMVSQ